MCNFWSCLVTKDKKVISELGVDNHHELVEMHNLDDNTSDLSQLKFARVEIVPKDNDPFLPLTDWKFKVDKRVRPEWFSPTHEDVCWERLKEVLSQTLITEDTDLIENRVGIMIKDCTMVIVKNSDIKRMYGSSVVQEMYDSSVVQEMYGSSVIVRYQTNTKLPKIKDGALVIQWSGEKSEINKSC